MDLLVVTVTVIVLTLALFEMAAVTLGVDSRDLTDDPTHSTSGVGLS